MSMMDAEAEAGVVKLMGIHVDKNQDNMRGNCVSNGNKILLVSKKQLLNFITAKQLLKIEIHLCKRM